MAKSVPCLHILKGLNYKIKAFLWFSHGASTALHLQTLVGG
jgi:hypothetical protein